MKTLKLVIISFSLVLLASFIIKVIEVKKVNNNNMELETITLGGGCYWCTESIFGAVKGVVSVESGYAGGVIPNPTYEQVCTGRTGYAEVVQIRFNPKDITIEEILLIFMVTHDPTTLNYQGNDRGSHYRSVIFYHNENQKKYADKVINELQEHYDKKIVTEVSPKTSYYKAEENQQDYYTKNPNQAYCNAVIPPKLEKLRKIFADKMK